MKIFSKSALKRLIIFVTLPIVVFILWIVVFHRPHIVPHNKYEYEFYKKMSASVANKSELDLSDLYPESWDELIRWNPYKDICSLKIDGYSPGGNNCERSSGDGNCSIMLLNKNKLVKEIRINIKKINWCRSKLPERISRVNAKFNFKSYVEWPEIELIDKN